MKLLGSISGAQYGAASMLKVSPYMPNTGDLYGMFRFRDKRPSDIPRSCRVEVVGDLLKEELSKCYLPHSISVQFIEQRKGDWLVSFEASDIIASVYMRLTAEEMEKVFCQLRQAA